MNFKTVFLVAVIIGAVYVHESDAFGLIKAKGAIIKAKLALAKAPHVIAHAAVAKEVKIKSKDAFFKSLEAAKATKLAVLSAITAPFRVAKKTIALKIAGVKAAKALKIAKIAKAAHILHNLKQGPIILPVPVAVPFPAPLPIKKFPLPIKQLPLPLPFPFPLPIKTLPSKPLFEIPAPPSLEQALGPLKGIIAGTRTVIQSAGNLPFSLLNAGRAEAVAPIVPPVVAPIVPSVIPAAPVPVPTPIVSPAPVYQFVPSVDFSNYNRVELQPKLEVPNTPAETYGPPSLPAFNYALTQ